MPTTSSNDAINESNHKQEPTTEKEHRGQSPFACYTKLGLLAVCVLSIGLTLLLGSLGFLWFLWLANDQDPLWRALADRNWVTRAVTLTSIAIRQSVSFQAAAATAMLASLALEYAIIPLLNLASVSTTRNANGGPYMLTWWLWKGFFLNPKRWRMLPFPLFVAVLASTTALTQLTSFALVSDLEIIAVQASNSSNIVPTHFKYNAKGSIPVITHGSTWSQYLQAYTSFAEYHEPPPAILPEGVIDTGVTLRAFLPVVDSQSRSTIAEWSGIATVLDAHTLCARPKLANPRLYYANAALVLTGGFWFDFLLSNGEGVDPQDIGLQPIGFGDGGCPEGSCPNNFTCMTALSSYENSNGLVSTPDGAENSAWRLTMCQPNSELPLFFLQSQFQNPLDEYETFSNENAVYGNAYVVLNVSSGSEKEWSLAIPSEESNLPVLPGRGTPPLGYGVHGQNNEWYDLIYSESSSLNLSVSICYTAFDTADLVVNMESRSNHSDLAPIWNATALAYNFSQIREQFGQEVNGSATYSDNYASRNILRLGKRDSWIPEPDFGDYVGPSGRSWIADYSNMAGSFQSNNYISLGGNQSRSLWQGINILYPPPWPEQLTFGWADATLMGLVQEILQTGGSLAFAVQSIVTSLTELAYYQQASMLNGRSEVTSSSFVFAFAPVRCRGIIAVTAVLSVHILMTFAVILPIFLTRTEVSALGNSWQAVAQVIGRRTQEILSKAPLATDSDAEGVVKKPNKKGKMENDDIVGLRLSCSEGDLKVRIIGAPVRTDAESSASGPVEYSTAAENADNEEQEEQNNLLQRNNSMAHG